MSFKKLFLLLICCFHISVISTYARDVEWRGVMIDVSRHFMPVDCLKKQIDIMGDNGINVLHLHLTDAAGWRLEIKKYPRLTEVGAWRTSPLWKDWWNKLRTYSDRTRGFGGYYTQEEMKSLVQYAQQRGVMIVPEIEFPAHSEEVVVAYPWVGFNKAEMDMKKDSTYIFMKDILTEVASIFPAPYIHCGGDESATQPRQQPEAMRRMRDIVRGLGKKMIVWDEALTADPEDSDIVIMIWRDQKIAHRAVEMGHQVILCPSKDLYLDSYQDCPASQQECMGGYRPLRKVYDAVKGMMRSSWSCPTTGEQKLLGIEACLFTEYVETPQKLEYQLWPRALVVGECANGKLREWEEFYNWALEETAALRKKGVNAFDLSLETGQRPEATDTLKHIARGCKIIYNRPFHRTYAASGESALVDGLQGTWNNDDGRWQGFLGNMDITVDLGKEKHVGSVSVSFLQITGPEIFLPDSISVQSMETGVGETLTIDPEDTPYSIKRYTLTLNTKARYLHLTAKEGERGGWLFCDEVEVK